jgi:hypothetical protein
MVVDPGVHYQGPLPYPILTVQALYVKEVKMDIGEAELFHLAHFTISLSMYLFLSACVHLAHLIRSAHLI